MEFRNGASYEGQFLKGKEHGIGIYRRASGKTEEREYIEGICVNKHSV